MLLDANVAQLVEQFTRNEQVAGSNPAISSKKSRMMSEIFCIQTEASEVWYIITASAVHIIKGEMPLYSIGAKRRIKALRQGIYFSL